MRKLFFLGLFFCLAVVCFAQTKVKQYEYWFDDSFSSKTSISIEPSASFSLNNTVATTGLPAGLHTIQIRFQDEKDAWSSTTSQFFVKKPTETTGLPKIVKYEYWFDNEDAKKMTQPVSSTSDFSLITNVTANLLPAGLHTFQIRFQDERGAWSSTTSQFFVKKPTEATGLPKIVKYEYWFDNEDAKKMTLPASSTSDFSLATNLTANLLPAGLHTFQIRFQDERGAWSSTISQFFVKQELQTINSGNKIVTYRYWVDKNLEKLVSKAVDPVNPFVLTNQNFLVKTVEKATPDDYNFSPDPSKGLKITYKTPALFNMQFKDLLGNWSSPSSDTVRCRYTVDVHCDTLLSKIPVTKPMTQADTIHFYMVNALEGDSLSFQTSQPLTIDLFDTFGKKLKTIAKDKSTIGEGIHAQLDGAYYALVHGFGVGPGNYTITYSHVAKYAVLAYTPKKVGNKGTAFMKFEGNGFSKNTKITLVKDNTTIAADSIFNRDLGTLATYFNFTNASIGQYDIHINFGDSTIVIEKGFEIEAIEELKLSVDILGTSALRAGTIGTYTISYKNESNATGDVIPIWIGMNSDAEVGFKFPLVVPTKSQLGNYPYFETDQLAGIKGSFKVYCFYIPKISAYEQGQLILNIKPSTNLQLFSWIGEPLEGQDETALKSASTSLLSTCDLPDICSDLKKVNIISGMYECGCGIAQGLIKTFSNMMLALQFQDRLDPYSQRDLQVAYDNGLIDESTYQSLTWIPPLENPYHIAEQALQNCNVSNSKTIIDGVKLVNGDYLKNWPDCLNPPTRHSTSIVRSYDPNDKIGYKSPSGSKYFRTDRKNFTYVINFENKALATAPAQEVYITDPLDLNSFDINSFKAGYIKVGNKIVQAPYDAQEHTWKIDMRPEMNLMTEVQLTLDKLTGIAKWYFKAIDPMTGTLPTDPFVGFLPPNDTIGSGQGSVSFSIDLKNNLADDANIDNKASIVFDYNDAIATPIWSNKKDIVAPTSSMFDAVFVNDSIATLTWQGLDNNGGSGVYGYNLYQKKGTQNFAALLKTSSLRAIDIDLDANVDYSFYVTAVDSAGNIEAKEPLAEVTIKYSPPSVVQKIGLNAGWNIISANVKPSATDMKGIFQSMIDAGKLKKVMDESGKTLENFGVFGGWKNNIGNWQPTEGYKVNVTAATVLTLEGQPIAMPFEIPLNTGWNIISYPAGLSQDAKAAFQSLIDAGKLKKLMDESGKTLENFGVFGGWKNNIGSLVAGKGYKVNVTGSCTLTITEGGTKAATIVPEVLASAHFKPVYTGNGTDHMTINLVELAASGIESGDELGVFDGSVCVGSAKVGADQLTGDYLSIPVSAGDGLNTELANGFTEGHRVTMRLYRDGKEQEANLEILSSSQPLFAKGESMFVRMKAAQTTGIDPLAQSDEMSVRCYPNPFSEQVTIEIKLRNPQYLDVKVYDTVGRLIKTLYKGESGETQKLTWDGRNEAGVKMASGTYLIKINETNMLLRTKTPMKIVFSNM